MRSNLAQCHISRSICILLVCLGAVAIALPLAQAATPHSQISFIQLTNTSGCVGDGGSFYPTFDRLVKKVAFSSSCDLVPGKNTDGNGEVFVMNFDGSGLVQLTNTTGGIGALHPEIDSSGQKIVFASDRDMISGGNGDGNFEIFTIQVNGTGLTQLTHTTGGNTDLRRWRLRRQCRSTVQRRSHENHLWLRPRPG